MVNTKTITNMGGGLAVGLSIFRIAKRQPMIARLAIRQPNIGRQAKKQPNSL